MNFVIGILLHRLYRDEAKERAVPSMNISLLGLH